MNKQESQNLIIGSWVLAGGEPRQVCSLTTKKAGFKRGTSGHRDFFVFGQLQSISLSEGLLKECVTYRDINPKEPNGKVQSLHCYSDTVIALHTEGRTEYHRFRYLHEVQAFLTSLYQLQVVLDLEKYKENVEKGIKAFGDWMKDMGKASEQAVAALKGVSDVFKEIKSTPCHSE